MKLNHLSGMDAVIFACADLPIECSYCGKPYKEHESHKSFFDGAFDSGGKIACCPKCFREKRYEERNPEGIQGELSPQKEV